MCVRWCSGTMISEDLYLSAGHCFDSVNEPDGWQVPKTNGTNDPIQPKEIARNMHVNFNYQVDPNGALRPTKLICYCRVNRAQARRSRLRHS